MTEAQQGPKALQERIDALELQLADAQQTAAKLREAHTEAAAEFVKTRDRLKRNHSSEIEAARMSMVARLFELADNLDRTVEAGENGGDGLLSGVQLVRDHFFQALAELGLRRFDPSGETFDPTRHDAIGVVTVQDADQANVIVNVLKPGYQADGRVLRAAMVQVGKLDQETRITT